MVPSTSDSKDPSAPAGIQDASTDIKHGELLNPS